RGKDNPSCTVVEMITPLGRGGRMDGYSPRVDQPLCIWTSYVHLAMKCPRGRHTRSSSPWRIGLMRTWSSTRTRDGDPDSPGSRLRTRPESRDVGERLSVMTTSTAISIANGFGARA